MKTCTSLLEIPHAALGVTIGNFDSVHIGHQHMLQDFYYQCKKRNLISVVITFSPHPRYILLGEVNFKLLNSLDQRRELLGGCDIDYLWEISFNRRISLLSPAEFMEEFLILPTKQVKLISLGHDFSLGHNKEGDFPFIEKYAQEHNIEVIKNSQYFLNKQPVSSGIIRKNIEQALMKETIPLLNRAYYLTGLVIKGNGRGRTLGFPTANIQIGSFLLTPPMGVYVTKTYLHGLVYQSITNIGISPSFNGERNLQIETHIFDFNLDIYGRDIQVHFIEKIRDEQKFESVHHLVQQIQEDCRISQEKLSNEYENVLLHLSLVK